MNLAKCRETYDEYTRKTSEIIRYLGITGIVLVWIFRFQIDDQLIIPSELLFPSYLLIVGLALDLLHAISGSIIWGIYPRIRELTGTKTTDNFKVPRTINWIPNLLFWAKTIVILIAYIFLIAFLQSRFAPK